MNTTSTTHPPSRDSDPLLRAIATGDEHCPDGKALAQLGRLIRGQQPLPNDLRARVETRIAIDEGQLASSEAERIDHLYENDAADPELDRLRGLFTRIGPAPVDLRDRVRRQLLASQRLSPITSDIPISSRAQAEQAIASRKRLRVIATVAVGHLAAVLMVAVMFANRAERTTPDDHGGAWMHTVPPVPKVFEHGPRDWTQIPGSGFDLFALRRSPELRAAARVRFNTERSAGAVACGVRWLLSKQTSDGRFSADGLSTAAVSPAESTATLSRQALATLALLGEGGGTTSVDRERMQAAQRALTALEQQFAASVDGINAGTRSQVALARIEGALLGACARTSGEAAVRDLAEHLDASTPFDGYALLAVETAQQGGLSVPASLLEHSRSALNTTLDAETITNHSESGRLGMTVFARAALGYRDNPTTATLSDALVALAPGNTTATTAVDTLPPTSTQDWWLATLALREIGGPTWDTWIAGLQSQLLPTFIDAGPGLAYVAPTPNPTQPNDTISATARAVLDLQVAYRYLPLSR